MINRIKIAFIALVAIAAPALMTTAVVSAQGTANGVCAGINLSAQDLNNDSCAIEDQSTNVDNLVNTIVNIFTWVVGVVSVIMIIVGGFKYVTSAGDSSGVGSAKSTIMYAIIGLVVVIMAQVIVKFVVQNVTN